MRKMIILAAPALLASTFLTGCQTWGPTWSELTGARYAAIGVLADDRRSLERLVTHGIDAELHEERRHLSAVMGLMVEHLRDHGPLGVRE